LINRTTAHDTPSESWAVVLLINEGRLGAAHEQVRRNAGHLR
jgi:hypothetical protein